MTLQTRLYRIGSVVAIAAMLLAAVGAPSLSPSGGTAQADGPTTVFINEIHYDNDGGDTGEAVEVAGPAGTDLAGWSIALYNGSSSQRNVYDTIDLSGTIPDQQNGYGTLDFPRAGIQNGSPDGLALVDGSSTVVQFLCYEGTFTAASGPATGTTCIDIGVAEAGDSAIGDSLQLTGTGTSYEDFTWAESAPNTFGAVNTGQTFGTPSGPTDPTGVGASDPDTVAPGGTSLLTVTVTPGDNPPSTGLAVSCDLTAIGGSDTQAFTDDGSGTNTFSYSATVGSGTDAGGTTLECTISDAEGRNGSAEVGLVVYAPLPDGTVFINELHYDNSGGDTGEAVEVAGPAGTDLTGWTIVLYNGNGGASYATLSLDGVLPDQQSGYGTKSFTHAGIQNGAPDGLALIDPVENVVQFLSYEGTFTASDGPAAGMTSTDIGVEEGSSTPVGDSLQLIGTGTSYGDFAWSGPSASSFGGVNWGQRFGPVPEDYESIHDIQYTTDASGDSPFAGQTVTTDGLVTGFFYDGGNKYTFIQDGSGPWSGLILYKPDAFINVGDRLEVHGQVSEYSGLTEIAYGSASVLSSGNPLPPPEVLSAGDVSQEQWESVFVKVANVTVTNPNLGHGEWQVGDASGDVVVDDLGSYGYSPASGDALDFVQGPLYYSFGAFKIEPRDNGDIGAPIEILPIGTVNGAVGDTEDGTTHRSPYAPPSGNGSGQKVAVQGVIYEKTLQATSFGGTYKGFYLQNTTATADGDPNTSDGLFVFMNTYDDLLNGYVPQVGDEVVISGTISEYYNMTELSYASLVGPVLRHGVPLDTEVPAVTVNPPDSLAAANRYWERLQGMRLQVPADTIVLGGRSVFSPADAEVWVARSDSTIAQRSDPYTRRAFRDAHPLDDNYDATNWDGNGYRILLGSLGIKATLNDGNALIAPARTFDTVTSSPIGGLNYTYGKYRIEIGDQISLDQGVDPADNHPPETFDRTQDYSIVDFNMENLYDYRNNPFSGCDFAGDSGCSNAGTPYLDPIDPAFDYVPASDDAYQARLNDIALQIMNDLHNPDIVMAQEIENQDFCDVSGTSLECGASHADGKPDVLQDLALKIVSLGGPAYDAAFDPDSSDLRGIVPAFLYRTDRVQLLSPAGDPLLGGSPAIPGYTAVPYDGDVSNPKTLNAELPSGISACETSWVFPRAPDIGLFRIWSGDVGSSAFSDVYVIDNHFKSGPDSCVAHRTEQAKYNAAIVAFLQGARPNAQIVLGGDLNVYPRPDDPFAPIGQPGSSDQLGALYNPDLGLKNLWEVLLDQAPESAYSYVYNGMAQTLDQMFVNQPMLTDLQQFRSAHINSDFPADYTGDEARGTSDHDPQWAEYRWPERTLQGLQDLVDYYDSIGQITGNNTAKALLDHLDKAARFEANGKDSAYKAQLQAFINQVQGKTPQFVTQEAADALVAEATVLLNP